MYWYKDKTVLIILFLVINVFLLGIIISNRAARRNDEKRNIQSAVEVLAANGIKVKDGIAYEKKQKSSMLSVQNVTSDEKLFAERILGEGVLRNNDGIYYVADKTVKIANGYFTYENLQNGENTIADKKDYDNVKKQLNEFGLDMKGSYFTLSGGSIICSKYIESEQLYDSRLTVNVNGEGQITRINGRWTENEEIIAKTKIGSISGAFISFLQDENRSPKANQIVNISLGQSTLLENSYKTAQTVPVWQITTNDGTTYFYEARQ